jgi:two-component system cell cycle sensor histidine kinase PleC
MRPGAHYKASVLRLVEGGHMRLVNEDESNRLLELHRADGTCLLIDERPLSGGGFVTLLTDITDRRRADTELTSIREEQRVLARRYHEEKIKAEAASRSKTSFLAHLSHDIRTPLNHIIGFADLMRHQAYGPLGDERYETYVESIKSSGDRLLSFFASILDLAELESGQRVMNQTELGVDDLLEGVTRRFSAQAKRAGLSLSLGAPCGALLYGDRFSLERMLGNLVENAVRFTPAGGRIKVAAFSGADGVVLEVTDTGIGMSPEKVSALSQPFAFSDASLTRDREGAGLGLAIARTIVELSGGNLVVDSRPGLGTTVAVSLPLHGEAMRIDHAA